MTGSTGLTPRPLPRDLKLEVEPEPESNISPKANKEL